MWRALGESIAASELRVDVECAPNLRRGPSGSGNLVSDVHAQALMSAVTHRNARSRPSNQCIGYGVGGLRGVELGLRLCVRRRLQCICLQRVEAGGFDFVVKKEFSFGL